MISSLVLIGLAIISLACGAEPVINLKPSLPQGPNRQIFLQPGAQSQYSPELQQNLNVLEPQFQYPGLNFPQNQPYPGVQPQPPQVLIYATPGQQFLYNPGAPPGNFLIPQPQPQPQPGVYFNGGNPQVPAFNPNNYPRPAYVPPIEKDAEEIPTNLNRGREATAIRQFFDPSGNKPQKLETFDEPARPSTEIDDLEGTPKNFNPKVYNKKPVLPNIPQLKPGQQFFILNGQDIFSGFPFQGQQPILQPGLHQPNPEVLIYGQQPQYLNQPQDLFQRNTVTGQISDIKPNNLIPNQNENLADLNANDFRQSYFINNPFPFTQHQQQQQQQLINNDQIDKEENALFRMAKNVAQPSVYNYYQVPYFNNLPVKRLNNEDEDDTVVIDAKVQSDDVKNEVVVASTTKKPEEPSLSQADPAAIAVAGVGGVAEAAPRGTALTGNKGLAVSSPKATAIAGPKSDEQESNEKSKKA